MIDLKIVNPHTQLDFDIINGNKTNRSIQLKKKLINAIYQLSRDDIIEIQKNMPFVYIREIDSDDTLIKGIYDWRFNIIIINKRFYENCVNKKYYHQIFECVQHEFIHYVLHILYFKNNLELYENPQQVKLNEIMASQLPHPIEGGACD